MSENKRSPFAVIDRTGEYYRQDIDKNHAMGIISYLSWVVLVPIFAAKDSAYARFHANQGLILAILETAISVVAWILQRMLGRLPLIGFGFRVLGGAVALLSIPVTIYAIIAFVGAIRKKALEIPFINSIKLLK